MEEEAHRKRPLSQLDSKQEKTKNDNGLVKCGDYHPTTIAFGKWLGGAKRVRRGLMTWLDHMDDLFASGVSLSFAQRFYRDSCEQPWKFKNRVGKQWREWCRQVWNALHWSGSISQSCRVEIQRWGTNAMKRELAKREAPESPVTESS